MITEKSEKISHSIGSLITPSLTSVELNSPLRPSSGIQEIVRMMLEVQNGIVHTRNSAICMVAERTWKLRKYATKKPITRVASQTIRQNLAVDRYVLNVTHSPGSWSRQPSNIST